MIMIEDEELRSLYQVSSSEHIQKIEAGILFLEKHPKDKANLEELLREAHSLKGDSRMLGVGDVETLIHQIEDVFVAIKKGDTSVTPDLCDRLYQGVDAVSKIAHEAVTGEPANVKVFHALTQLMGADHEPAMVPIPSETSPLSDLADLDLAALMHDDMNRSQSMGDDELHAMFADFLKEPSSSTSNGDATDLLSSLPSSLPQTIAQSEPFFQMPAEPQVELLAPPVVAKSAKALDESDYQISTLRVKSTHLDRLLTQASELLVTQGRFSDRTSDIQTIQNLWEEWNSEVFVSRLAFDQLERRLQSPELKPIHDFYQQANQRLEQLGNAIAQLKNASYPALFMRTQKRIKTKKKGRFILGGNGKCQIKRENVQKIRSNC
jgi:two-component system, chemotaxis family, sensor kinase CheA